MVDLDKFFNDEIRNGAILGFKQMILESDATRFRVTPESENELLQAFKELNLEVQKSDDGVYTIKQP